jgi:hypothetical protein
MSAMDDIRADLNRQLHVTHGITNQQGAAINVGENFGVSIIVSNTDSAITFRNVTLSVSGTGNATPTGGSPHIVQVGTLVPGQTQTYVVGFKATKSLDVFIPGGGYPYQKPVVRIVSEPIATIVAKGDVDIGLVAGLAATRSASVDIRP